MLKNIPVSEPLLNGNEKQYLIECIESGWIGSDGPFVSKFEQEFAQFVGRRHGVAVANGTCAIDIAICALELKPGDEVILPAFTIISCILQMVRSGITPVLVDADPITWNMNVADIEAKIGPKTKAIMAVHIYGLPVDMDPLLNLAKKYNLKVIEDAAEMHGQKYKNQICGSFGDISTFSFYSNKIITTGEGGMVLTDDDEVAQRCRDLRNLYMQPKKRFVHEGLGWNMRMSNMQAAIGLAQLERISELVALKKKIGHIYNQKLADLPGIRVALEKTDYAENNYWIYGVVLEPEIKANAAEVMNHLANVGIGTRPFFYPLNKQPILNKMGFFENESHPVAENLASRGFYIPSGMTLTDSDCERVVSELIDIIRKFNQ